MIFSTDWPQFYAATILNWQLLLSNDKYKDIIIESLQYCVKENKVKVYVFVIMSNHIHLVWQPLHPVTKAKLQHHFMTFTPALVGIRSIHSHPLPNHTNRRCWYAAEDVAEGTNNM